jgi:hypothetical protein
MSDTVLIVIIITAAVLLILFMFRNQLSRFLFKANKDGVEAELETKETPGSPASTGSPTAQPGASVRRVTLIGKGSTAEARGSKATVEDVTGLGVDQTFSADSTKPESKPRQ